MSHIQEGERKRSLLILLPSKKGEGKEISTKKNNIR